MLSPASTLAPRRTLTTIVFILSVLTMVRLVGLSLSQVELFTDESQYWSWSRDLALGYFSKPPLLAWLIASVQHICGDSEACIRAPAPLMNFATSLFAYGIGRTLYDARTGLWAALLTAFGTGAIFAARVVATDTPMVMFEALALLAYVHLLRQSDWRWAVAMGAAVGAGLLSKYAMIYFVAGMLTAAVLEKPARQLFAGPELWLAFGVTILTMSPNIAWNAANGFLTVRHAGNNVVGEAIEPSVLRLLEFLAAQFAVFGPVVFGVGIVTLAGIRSKELRSADRILLAFALPPLVVVSLTATVVHAYANWAAASLIPLVVLAAAILVRRNSSFLLWGSLALGLATQIALIGGDKIAPHLRLPFFAANPYERTLGWSAHARQVGELARRLAMPVIASDDRASVAALLYYWRDQPEQVLAWATIEDLPTFDLTRGLTTAAPQPILFVSQCPRVERLERFYAKVTPLGSFVTQDRVPRYFAAAKLEQPRGPIQPLAPCLSVAR